MCCLHSLLWDREEHESGCCGGHTRAKIQTNSRRHLRSRAAVVHIRFGIKHATCLRPGFLIKQQLSNCWMMRNARRAVVEKQPMKDRFADTAYSTPNVLKIAYVN
eukprot:6206071-Pleurochrysis_carterae.AAC.1